MIFSKKEVILTATINNINANLSILEMNLSFSKSPSPSIIAILSAPSTKQPSLSVNLSVYIKIISTKNIINESRPTEMLKKSGPFTNLRTACVTPTNKNNRPVMYLPT